MEKTSLLRLFGGIDIWTRNIDLATGGGGLNITSNLTARSGFDGNRRGNDTLVACNSSAAPFAFAALHVSVVTWHD
jgi:hypothetical protein